jgi:glucosamine-6-phosphate deaminase
MDIRIHPDAATAARAAAKWVASFLRRQPKAVLGLTGGRTPVKFYGELVKLHRKTGVSFRGVTTFNLDEYVGVTRTHPAAFARALDQDLLDLVDIRKKNTFAPQAGREAAFERQIRAAGGLDLQFLGIGPDGHIGFNAPGCSLGARTHVTPLTRQGFAEAEERFQGLNQPVPRHGVTMGVSTILAARQTLMLAFGAGKARAVAEMIEGAVSASWPASALQLHTSVVVFLDEEAASALRNRDAYAWAAAAGGIETSGRGLAVARPSKTRLLPKPGAGGVEIDLPPAGAGGSVRRTVSRRGSVVKSSKEKR